MSLALPYPSMVFVPLDVLTADEMNHIVANYEYISNQFPLSSDNIDSATYTTAEQVVGTWTNGKPIYRRVININNPSTTNTNYVQFGDEFQDLVSLRGVMFSSTGHRVPIPQTDSSSTYAVLFVSDGNTLRGRFSFAGAVPTSVFVIMEYTKNTD